MQLPNTENSTIADAEECVTEHIAIDVAKKCKKRLVMIKIEFHFFVLFLKPIRTKIFAFNDF